MQCMFRKLSFATLGLVIGHSLQAAPYMEDAITNAAVGSNLGSALPWGSSSSQIKVASGNLTNAALLDLAPAGNMASIAGSGGGSSYRPFWSSAVSGGVVFYSFLVQCTSLPTSGDKYLTGLLPSGNTSPQGSGDALAVYTRISGTGYQLGIRKSGASTTYASTVLALNATNFIVVCYIFGPPGGAASVRLYISPTPGAGSPATADATLSGGTDAPNLQNVYLKSSSGYGTWNFDTLRVGPTWASVTPAVGAEPPPAQPCVTQTLICAQGVVLRGTNGTPGGVYQVLSATNLLRPLAEWPAIATNRFDSNGGFDCTNPVTAVESRFYRLLLGGEIVELPIAPAITTQPADQIVAIGQDATFNVVATGTLPLRYLWYFNTNTLLADSTNAPLTVASAQTNQAGAYFVIVTNSAGALTSVVATLQVNPPSTNLFDFDLTGFAAATTGGGTLPETDVNYRKVYTPDDFRLALANGSLKVIEIMSDLDLGWNEIPPSARTGDFRQNTTPSLHPALIASGVSLIDIQDKNGLTIFSANGATIRHAEFNVKRCNNLIIRNLRFDELWEWDESSKGDYDNKDWDFMTIDMNSTNVWVDHCDFTKAYDGVVDIKGGSHNITISWCRFVGDDGGTNSFVRQQINALEQNASSYAMYNFLRTVGFSVEDIIAITRSQKKGHLVGATEFNAENANLSVTLHHNYYYNFQDRMPRLRGGNSHVFNAYLLNTEALAAKRLRDARVAAMSPSDALKLSNGTYKFDVTLNGAISTEDGAVLVENSYIVDTIYPIRNNQTDPGNPDYTGKIRALDTFYALDGATFRGGSEDLGSPLAPVPATPKSFSWNGFTSLPYSYVLDDPTSLVATLTSTNGPGSGVITWAKTNWLKTAY
jgi:pectate lyase